MWGYLKEWFTLPRLIFTTGLFFIFYILYQLPTIGTYLFYGLQIFFSLCIIIRCRALIKRQQYSTQKTGKSWLLETIIFKTASSNILVFCCNFYTVFPWTEFLHEKRFSLIAAFFSVLMILVSYITLELIPRKSKELLAKHSPEYALV